MNQSLTSLQKLAAGTPGAQGPKNVADAPLCVGISGIGMPPVQFFG